MITFTNSITHTVPQPSFWQFNQYLEKHGWQVCFFNDVYVRYCLPTEGEDYKDLEGPYQPWKHSLVLMSNSHNYSRGGILCSGSAIEVLAKVEERSAMNIYKEIMRKKPGRKKDGK